MKKILTNYLSGNINKLCKKYNISLNFNLSDNITFDKGQLCLISKPLNGPYFCDITNIYINSFYKNNYTIEKLNKFILVMLIDLYKFGNCFYIQKPFYYAYIDKIINELKDKNYFKINKNIIEILIDEIKNRKEI